MRSDCPNFLRNPRLRLPSKIQSLIKLEGSQRAAQRDKGFTMVEQSDTLGSISVSPGHLIRPPPIPSVVSEWIALSPLVFHLASSQDDYTTAGDISLLGQFPVSLFPPLGTFSGMARLLERGNKYLDYASSKGGSSQTVWDLKYGSVFPVANGAASASIISMSIKKQHKQVKKCHKLERAPRPQILNVYNFSKAPKDEKPPPWKQRLNKFWQASLIIVLLGLCVFFAVFGAFGTAAIALLCAVSRGMAQSITFDRPLGYLESTEEYTACMLVAAHGNALEWHLFIGDKGVVDTLLNKPMIVIPEENWIPIASMWFRVAHIAQLIAMTFSAANKGWDGVCLVILLVAHYSLSWQFRRDALVKDWLGREKVTVLTNRFEFSGRMPLIGTIHMLSGAKSASWMDSILAPHPRRDTWLGALELPNNQAIRYPPAMTRKDTERVENDIKWTKEAMEIVEESSVLAIVKNQAKSTEEEAKAGSDSNA